MSIPKNIKNNGLFLIISEILDKSLIKLQLVCCLDCHYRTCCRSKLALSEKPLVDYLHSAIGDKILVQFARTNIPGT